MKYVVQFSGGVGSWAAAKRIAQEHGTENLVLLFADTLIEDEDLYRFLHEAAANVGGDLVIIAEGRDPWQVFFDERFLGNSRVDPCSKILKRKLLDKWVSENCDPADTTLVFGIDWSESHRLDGIRERIAPWQVAAPMCEAPYYTKAGMLDWLKAEGIEPPRLYRLGFPHNNCGGFCVKAGHAHFKLLLDTMPERFAYHEAKEAELRAHLGKDVSILKQTFTVKDEQGRTVRDEHGRPKRGSRPMTLTELRERVEAGDVGQLDLFEWGGCGCALPT